MFGDHLYLIFYEFPIYNFSLLFYWVIHIFLILEILHIVWILYGTSLIAIYACLLSLALLKVAIALLSSLIVLLPLTSSFISRVNPVHSQSQEAFCIGNILLYIKG